MKEGHAALLTLELLGEKRGEGEKGPAEKSIRGEDIEKAAQVRVHHAHAVPAGHDRFRWNSDARFSRAQGFWIERRPLRWSFAAGAYCRAETISDCKQGDARRFLNMTAISP